MRLIPLPVIASLLALSLSTLPGWAQADLSIGDQRGNARAVLQAAGELEGIPYAIEWHEFANAAPLLEALNAGSLDAGLVGDAPLTFAAAAGLRAKAIQASAYLGNALIVNGNTALQQVSQLKGLKIATVKGSSGHAMALQALEKAGISSDQVQFVFTTPAEATLVLSQGGVDAVATWEPYVSFAQQQSGVRILADGKDFPALNYLVAADPAIHTKADPLHDFSQRLNRARAWGVAHPQAYAEAIAQLLKIPQSVALAKVQRESNAPLGDFAQVTAKQQATIDLYAQQKLIPAGFDASQVVDARFNRAPLASSGNGQ